MSIYWEKRGSSFKHKKNLKPRLKIKTSLIVEGFLIYLKYVFLNHLQLMKITKFLKRQFQKNERNELVLPEESVFNSLLVSTKPQSFNAKVSVFERNERSF